MSGPITKVWAVIGSDDFQGDTLVSVWGVEGEADAEAERLSRLPYGARDKYDSVRVSERELRGARVDSGIALIATERRRQIESEGWTPEHDDEHARGEMAKAAACYAVHGTDARVVEGDSDPQDAWPWARAWDKRRVHSQLRALAIAGALIAAEIDRMLRGTADTGARRGTVDTGARS